MAEGHTVSVDIDGETREIELPDGYLPEDEVRESYVPKDHVDRVVSDRVKKREKELKGELSSELLASDDFMARMVDVRGDEIKDALGVKSGDDPDIEALRRERSDLESKLEATTEETNRLRERALRGDIQDAMSKAGIVDEEDVRDLVPLWIRERMEYDPDLGRHVVTDKDGNVRYGQNENGETVPMGPRELLLEEAKAGRHKGWFKDMGRDGIDFKGSRGGTGAVTLETFEKMDSREQKKLHDQNPDLYRRLQRQRARAGEDKLYGAVG